MNRRVILVLLFTIFNISQQTNDICNILDANYCFYFSDASCYINLCKCDECSNTDKVKKILEEDESPRSTNSSNIEPLCPTWCPHVKANATIFDELTTANSTQTEDISFDCGDLKTNCLDTKGYNGHCYFYEKSCEYDREVSNKGKPKKNHNRLEKCLKFQRKCHQKYEGHYACKQLKKRCKGVKLPELVDGSINNSTTVQTKSPLEQCLNFQNICARKYPKHFACRQFRKRCTEYSLPPLPSTTTIMSVTDKDGHNHHHHHNRHHKKMRRGHGGAITRISNETVIISDEISIGNDTIIESLLKS